MAALPGSSTRKATRSSCGNPSGLQRPRSLLRQRRWRIHVAARPRYARRFLPRALANDLVQAGPVMREGIRTAGQVHLPDAKAARIGQAPDVFGTAFEVL